MTLYRYEDGQRIALTPEEEAAWQAEQPSAEQQLAAARAGAVQATKAEARRRIELIAGDSNNRERTLRWAAQIADMRNTTHAYPQALDEPWATRETALRQAGAAMEAIAAASNTIEGDVPALVDLDAVRAWVAAMPTDGRWP